MRSPIIIHHTKNANLPIDTQIASAIAHLEAQIFTDAWNQKTIHDMLNNAQIFALIAFCDDMLVGYLLYQISDVAELLRIGTFLTYRRHGIAKQLLTAWLDDIRQWHHPIFATPTHAILEVSASNHIAIALYQKFGFKVIHRRPNYYQSNNISTDALIMQKAICTDNTDGDHHLS